MRAIILAAGRGSRLGSYTADRPKCLAELGGMTLIGRQLATLRGAGIDDIVIVTGYRAAALAGIAARRVHNPDWAETNMVASLFRAEAAFTDDFIVAYADIVYERRVLDRLLASPHPVSVIVDAAWRDYWQARFDDPLSDAESLRLDEAGRILDIGDEVADIDEIEGQYIGLMRFSGAGIAALRAAYDGIRTGRRPWMARRPASNAYMTDLLMEMILLGHDVHAVPVENGWLEIDTVDDYERARDMFENGTIDRFFEPAGRVADVPARRNTR